MYVSLFIIDNNFILRCLLMNINPLIVPHSNFFIEALERTTKYDMYNYHLHQEFEIYYLVSGERKYFINDNIYIVQAGSLVLIDANEIHKTGNIDNHHHERIVMYFDHAFLETLCPQILELNLLTCFKSKYRVLPLSFKYKNSIETILDKMLTLYLSKDNYEDLRKEFYLQLLLAELLILINNFIDDLKTEEFHYSQIMHPKISRIIEHINDHYHEPISLTSMAKEVYMSPSYLSKLFKNTTNFTFTQYLNSVRIKNSQKLLKNPNYRIIDVAQKVGFTNNTHFTRVFKEIIGMSPTNYRKSLKLQR